MSKKCQDVMTRDPACCVPEDTMQHVAKLMKDRNIGPVPVCDSAASRRLVGIVTDRDMVLKVIAEGRDPTRTRVGDIMTREVFSCQPGDDIQEAVEAMERYQVRRIPVIEQGRLVGIIAQADIATRLRTPEKTAEVVAEVSRPGGRAGGA